MTDHEKIRSLVDDFVDGTLAREDLQTFLTHIKTCAACAEEVVRTRSRRAADEAPLLHRAQACHPRLSCQRDRCPWRR